jgi:hypothetical protein
LRNSKSYKKDFVTGETIEVNKLKPSNGSRGITKIELFEDGQLVEETVSENFITGLMDSMARMASMHVFTADHMRTNASNGGTYGPGWLTTSATVGGYNKLKLLSGLMNDKPTIQSPLQNIVLTSDVKPEDVNETILEGDIIGFCPMYNTVPGADTKRGVFNELESYLKENQMHLVYDFATSNGNGTFGSVAWNGPLDKHIIYPMPEHSIDLTAPAGYSFNNNLGAGSFYRESNGLFYFLVNKTADYTKRAIVGYRIDKEAGTALQESIIEITIASALNTWRIWDFDFHESTGDIYIILREGFDYVQKLYRFASTGGSSINLPNGQPFYTLTWNSANNSAKTALMIKDEKIVLFPSLVASSTGYLEPFVLNMADFTVYKPSLRTALINEPQHFARVFGSNEMWASLSIGSYMESASYEAAIFKYDLEINTLTVTAPLPAIPGDLKPFYIYEPPEDMNSCLIKKSGASYDLYFAKTPSADNYPKVNLHIHKIGYLGARNLLPAPITKTNTKTMKITYDFYIEV